MGTAAGAATVRVERAGGVARITLDRPPLNVLDIVTLGRLDAVLQVLSGEHAVKVVALAGAGKAFCAGVDVADHAPGRVKQMIRAFHRAIRRLMSLEVPTVALVHGPALGGGCELALACDIVLSRADLRLGQPEIKLGVFPPVAAALLPRLVGWHAARELVLSGRQLGAEEARGLGLVSHVYATECFEKETGGYLESLTAMSGPALRIAKRAIQAGLDQPLEMALQRAEALYLDDLMATADAHEGIAAFLARRTPVWKDA